jgi:predicted SnoaL-like aldol condensation-catalyzing enzyme
MTTSENTALVVNFYTHAFNDGRPEEAAAAALGETYIQHNPGAPDGPAAFVGYVQSVRERFPEVRVEIMRTIAEGDLVVTHSRFTLGPADRGRAVADIWRIEGGKIVEHWDVIQEIPEQAANANTMF